MTNNDQHKRLRYKDKQNLPTNLPGDNASYPSELGLFDLDNPDITLFNYVDDELIKLAGSEVWIYKYHQDESYDDLYDEHPVKAIDPNPIVAFGHYDPRPIEENLTEFGIEITNDQVFVFNKDYLVRNLGRPLISGDIIKPKFQDLYYEVYEVQEDSFEAYGVYHLRATARIYRETEGVFFSKPSISDPDNTLMKNKGKKGNNGNGGSTIAGDSWFTFAYTHEDPIQSAFNPGRDVLGAAPITERVLVENDYLIKENGEKIKLYGISVSKDACAPPIDQAERIARRLATLGFNLVRFHIFAVPQWLFNGATGRLEIDTDFSNRLFHFQAQLQLHGIYSAICLRDLRAYRPYDNVPTITVNGEELAVTPDRGELVNYFHPDVIQYEKDFLNVLLNTISPYTGRTLANDPAVAILEIMNENSLIAAWLNTHLDYIADGVNLPSRQYLTEPYFLELNSQYQTWLNSKFSTTQEVLDAWGKESLKSEETLEGGTIERLKFDDVRGQELHATEGRIKDMLAFLNNIQHTAFDTYKTYLNNNLGVTCPIIGTQLYNGLAHQHSLRDMDMTDVHAYYDHATFQSAGKELEAFTRHNKSIIEYPVGDDILGKGKSWTANHAILANMIKGKPSYLSETLASHVNDYEYEFWPVHMSYMQYYGLDAVAAFQYADSSSSYTLEDIDNHLLTSNDPSFLTQSMLAAIAFRKGYIKEASAGDFQIIAMEGTEDEWYNSYVALAENDFGKFLWNRTGIKSWMTYEVPIVRSYTDAQDIIDPGYLNGSKSDDGIYTNTTKELMMYNKTLEDSFFRCDASKYQVLVGNLANKESNNIRTTGADRGAVVAVSLDGQNIGYSNAVAMSVIAGVRGQGREFIESGKWDELRLGSVPWEIKHLPGTVTLGTTKWQSIKCYPVNEDFSIGDEVTLTRDTNTVTFTPGDYNTPLFVFNT